MTEVKRIRQPTLADRLLAVNPHDYAMKKAWVERRFDQLRTAKKFVLDAQAAGYLGEMLKKHPRIIADAQDFAIPPFKNMWVELPFLSFYRAITDREPDATSDTEVGYLFTGPTVTVAAASNRKGRRLGGPSFMPIEYTLHRPMPLEEQLALAERLGISRIGLDFWFWGESAEAFVHDLYATDEKLAALSDWDREGLRALRDNHSVQLAPMRTEYEDVHKKIYDGSGGDLRNIVGLLLFLNRTKDVQHSNEIPMGQTLINRKPRPMLPHRIITLRLDPQPRFAKLVAGMTGIRRRLHDVRGHYCHDKKARNSGCLHGKQTMGDWGDWWYETAPLHWECCGCEGQRWWRREHHRGSAEIGIIREQRYAVTR